MKIVFISCFYNHHQKPLCDCLYKATEGNFHFIATDEISEERKKLGYQDMSASYVIRVNNLVLNTDEKKLINDADIVILGDARTSLVKKRLEQNKLTFLYSERIYKQPVSLVKLIVHRFKFYFRYRKHKSLYLLCASAYAAGDYSHVGCFKNKAFKWGYFPQTIRYGNIDSVLANKYSSKNNKREVKICWAGRFISWKHPEVALEIANRLHREKVAFTMVIIGDGPMRPSIEQMINKYELSNKVHLSGPMNPSDVRREMETSDIYLFTSDRNEGWGAVINEAMNSLCAVVANWSIGAVPFLLQDEINGLVYKGNEIENIYMKVKKLIIDSDLRTSVAIEAYNTILNEWNAEKASERIIQLANNVDINRAYYSEGLCSMANIINE